ncbi:MAG: CBS domain-containing protein, partial [Anaerolineae bacterium]
GIYADTGSLTYDMTTPRDIYAAGWALQQGGLLDVVRDFMSHPLTAEQLDLYETLLDHAQTIQVAGNPVVIASASVPDYRGEIAVLAHQLRDLLDPTALFLLVELEKHIQLVARANVDTVDVGAVARQFGGGGHARAAAARIKAASLDEAHEQLVSVVQDSAAPTLQVGSLMSRGVRTLRPDQRVDEAAREMSRTGHEGFPVIDESGHVVGLATRRAIDRAMGHGLVGLSVAEVMEAGSHGVRSDDPLSAVRQIMVELGWGHVPVVDEDGVLVGIITRTDLIKHQHSLERPVPAGLAQRLEEHLPGPILALMHEAGRAAAAEGASLFAVGGFVRDLLLERPTVDIDFVVEGDAEAVARRLVAQHGGRLTVHAQFGTARWHLPEGPLDHVDFATARTEFYPEPTALPEVERSSIKLDLHRRDFTINTLALRLDPQAFGQLLDFFGGVADLREGRIRVLHSMSFVDDPTRMLRAVRFEQRFGFTMEPRTQAMIGQWLPMIDRVSGDRLRHEIELIMAEPKPERGLRRLAELGVLQAIHPGLEVTEEIADRLQRTRSLLEEPAWPELTADDFTEDLAYFTAMTAALPPGVIEAICDRLQTKRQTLNAVLGAHAALDTLAALTDDSPPHVGAEALDGLPDAALAGVAARFREPVLDYVRRLRHIQPHTDGHTLKAMGLKPGPSFGRILRRLRRAWLDGVGTSRDQEQHLLVALVEDDTNHD